MDTKPAGMTLGQLMKLHPEFTQAAMFAMDAGNNKDWALGPLVFDKTFDNDGFFDKLDCPSEMRGDEPYYPPCGWKQKGINLQDMAWLDQDGEDSWPVAYHGTKHAALDPIMGSQLRPGTVNWYGKGIYCSPKIKEAEYYCGDNFVQNGKKYKFVFKCRVNPKDRVFCQDKKGPETYWYITNPDSIRFYKLCIKRVK